MIKTLYDYYVSLFGHPTQLNGLINMMADSSIQIGESVTIDKGTSIIGNVDIGTNVSLSSNVAIYGTVNIGEHTNLNGNNLILGEISIGKYCAIAPRVQMRTKDHETYKPCMQMRFYNSIDSNLEHVSNGPINIGNDVWIASDAKILSDVSIGNGAVVAANSVVVDDVEPYSFVAGNPAEHKKYRFDRSTREALQEIAWWDWSKKKQKQNKSFFETDLRNVDNIYDLIK